jgi:mRNA interferase MazF
VARIKSPRRGEVHWLALDPTLGTEIQKTRPAVIVSNDAMNRHGTRVVVVPLTSNVDHCYPGEAIVSVKGKPARALGDQLRSIDRIRLRGRLAILSSEDVLRVEQALAITLALL